MSNKQMAYYAAISLGSVSHGYFLAIGWNNRAIRLNVEKGKGFRIVQVGDDLGKPTPFIAYRDLEPWMLDMRSISVFDGTGQGTQVHIHDPEGNGGIFNIEARSKSSSNEDKNTSGGLVPFPLLADIGDGEYVPFPMSKRSGDMPFPL